MKINHLQKFDSFSQEHPKPFKNHYQDNYKNHNAYLEVR